MYIYVITGEDGLSALHEHRQLHLHASHSAGSIQLHLEADQQQHEV